MKRRRTEISRTVATPFAAISEHHNIALASLQNRYLYSRGLPHAVDGVNMLNAPTSAPVVTS